MALPAPREGWPTTASEESDWRSVRDVYLHDPDQIYLNTGSWGVMPRPVYDALIASHRELELNPTRNRQTIGIRVQEARVSLGRLLHADPRDLSLVTNVTVAINIVVNGLQWQPGDEILASDQEYGAIENCLNNASRRWGVKINHAKIPIPPESPDQIVRAFEEALTERTRLIVCSHITTRTGMITPIRELAELAHAHGALIAIDGAHAPGMIPIDLVGSGCDFYGGNCHKWLCSPKGVGFLFARPELQGQLQHLIVSWGYSPEGTVKDDEGRFVIKGNPAMWGLEHWGTVPTAEQEAMGVAVEFQENIGIERIAARGRQLAGYARARMAELPWTTLLSPSHPHMTGSLSTFRLAGFPDINLAKDLRDRYAITIPVYMDELPDFVVRLSTHIYNTFEEIDVLVEALETLHA